jgi:hypothetical protein
VDDSGARRMRFRGVIRLAGALFSAYLAAVALGVTGHGPLSGIRLPNLVHSPHTKNAAPARTPRTENEPARMNSTAAAHSTGLNGRPAHATNAQQSLLSPSGTTPTAQAPSGTTDAPVPGGVTTPTATLPPPAPPTTSGVTTPGVTTPMPKGAAYGPTMGQGSGAVNGRGPGTAIPVPGSDHATANANGTSKTTQSTR